MHCVLRLEVVLQWPHSIQPDVVINISFPKASFLYTPGLSHSLSSWIFLFFYPRKWLLSSVDVQSYQGYIPDYVITPSSYWISCIHVWEWTWGLSWVKTIMATSCQLYSQVPLATTYTSLIVFSDSQLSLMTWPNTMYSKNSLIEKYLCGIQDGCWVKPFQQHYIVYSMWLAFAHVSDTYREPCTLLLKWQRKWLKSCSVMIILW